MADEPHPDSAGQLEQFRGGIRFLALRSLGDSELADEVAQETLARALIAIRDGRRDPPRCLQAYVLGIARNVIAGTIRARGRNQRLLQAYDRTREPSTGALQQLVDAERAEQVRIAVRELSSGDREILRLAYFEGLRSREIAERLDEPGDRIRKRKSRALARLRAAYLSLDSVTEDKDEDTLNHDS